MPARLLAIACFLMCAQIAYTRYYRDRFPDVSTKTVTDFKP